LYRADKVVFGVSPTILSWIGSSLILGGAIWVAAAKDTTPPDKKRRREWAKEDLAFGGTGGAAELVHAEGSSTKRGTYLSEEQEGLMTSHDDHDDNEYSDPEAIESIELQDIDAESRDQ
jgi:hypothetical protein